MLLLPPSVASTSRRSRGPSIAVVLTTAIAFLPHVVGFGLSGIGVGPAANGAFVPRAPAAALERPAGWEGKQQARKWRRRAHEITCRVKSPRRYGSAVSVDCALQDGGEIGGNPAPPPAAVQPNRSAVALHDFTVSAPSRFHDCVCGSSGLVNGCSCVAVVCLCSL